MAYKINFKSHLRAMEWLLFFLVALVGLWVYDIHYEDIFDNTGWTIVLLVGLIPIIPGLLVYLEYFLINKTDSVIIEENYIDINDRRFFPKDIIKVTLYMPPVWHRKGTVRFLPFEDFHFAIVKLADGVNFTFTSLLSSDVELAFQKLKGITVDKKVVVIASKFLIQ